MRISSGDVARGLPQGGNDSSSSTPLAASGTANEGAFGALMTRMGREIDAGETTVRGLVSSSRGRDLAPSELISLQARVYRYSEAVDVASRAIDRGTSGIKAVLQGGGQ